MEYRKIISLLDTTSDTVPRFNTKIWIGHDQSEEWYNIKKQIRFKTSMLRSDTCDNSHAYIVIKGTITVERVDGRDKPNRSPILKDNAPFVPCVLKSNVILIENSKDLDNVIPV